jgi:hypothetical protein
VAFVFAVLHVKLICVELTATACRLDGGLNGTGMEPFAVAEYAENP